MAAFRKAKQLPIAVNGREHTVTVDAEDYDRVVARVWKPIPLDQNRIHFYHDLGAPGRPAFELLEHFILKAKPHEFVELIDRSPTGSLDLRKSNLQVRSAATPTYPTKKDK